MQSALRSSGGLYLFMTFDIDQWRAAIGCFCSSRTYVGTKFYHSHPLTFLLLTITLYIVLYMVVAVLIPLLPLTAIIQCVIEYEDIWKMLLVLSSVCLHRLTVIVAYIPLTASIWLLPRSCLKFLQNHVVNGAMNLANGYINIFCPIRNFLSLPWVVYKKNIESGDIETNPGPINRLLSFCTWNLNSISAHDFIRVSLLEAYNAVYSYDLIGIVETHLDGDIDIDKLNLNGYYFINSNHPQNRKRGGVGLYIRESFPYRRRSDLEILPECIVSEFHINRRKYFFVVLYRSPSQNQAQFQDFIHNFESLVSKIADESPHCMIITGDLNCRSTNWWEGDIDNEEGISLEASTTDLGLYQMISEPTHFMGSSRSCIDLVFTDQPNIFLETGVHPSLHEQCHHQIIYGKLAMNNLPPLSHNHRLWFYDQANVSAIRKSIEMYNWLKSFDEINCPNEQVNLLNEVLLNIFSNFIPNKIVKVKPQAGPLDNQDH